MNQTATWWARIARIAPSREDTLVYEFFQVAPARTIFLNTTETIRTIDKKILLDPCFRRSDTSMYSPAAPVKAGF